MVKFYCDVDKRSHKAIITFVRKISNVRRA